MPITDLGSYVTTGNGVDAHWSDVNTDRSANALPDLTLPDGYTLSDLTSPLGKIRGTVSDGAREKPREAW
jgi:hypothetical protein